MTAENGLGTLRRIPFDRLRTHPWLLAWLAILPVAALRAGDLAESDTFWQIRTGAYILDHLALPASDLWSWTAYGSPWRMNSWGFDVVVAAAYRAGGLAGVAMVCALGVTAIAALVLWIARHVGARPFPTGALLLAGSTFLIEWFSARPQLVDYAALLGLVLLLERLLRRSTPFWVLAAIGALAVVWVNLHAGALLGAAVAAAAAAVAMIRPLTRAAAPWLASAAVVVALGALLNPYGPGVLGQTASVRSAAIGLTEWQPLNPLDPVHAIPFALGVVALVLGLRRRQVVLSAALAVTLAGSVIAIRFIPMVLLLAVPLLATVAEAPVLRRYGESRRVLLRRMAVLAVIAYGAVGAVNVVHLGQPDPRRFSTAVVAAIPHGCRLFNSYDLGGLVLLERPDLAVSIDSRAELYGAARIEEYARIASGATDPARSLAGVGCVLMPPDAGLVVQLTRDPRWRLTRADPAAVLFERV